jgi:hypothetical protein
MTSCDPFRCASTVIGDPIDDATALNEYVCGGLVS